MTEGKILIIDDELAIGKSLSRILNAYNYESIYKILGRLGLEALEQDKFDAVIADIYIPDIDGLTLLCKIKEFDVNMPVILITGQSSDEAVSLALARGAFDYLLKPFETETILTVLKRAISWRKIALNENHSSDR